MFAQRPPRPLWGGLPSPQEVPEATWQLLAKECAEASDAMRSGRESWRSECWGAGGGRVCFPVSVAPFPAIGGVPTIRGRGRGGGGGGGVIFARWANFGNLLKRGGVWGVVQIVAFELATVSSTPVGLGL